MFFWSLDPICLQEVENRNTVELDSLVNENLSISGLPYPPYLFFSAYETCAQENGGMTVAMITHDFGLSPPYGVSAQRRAGNGDHLWTKNLNYSLTDRMEKLHVIESSDNGTIFGWENNGLSSGLYLQKVNASGDEMWGDDPLVAVNKSGAAALDDVLSDGNGGAILIWRFTNIIYAQRILENGTFAWNTDGVIICNAPETRYQVDAIADGNDGVILVWKDSRDDPGSDIYMSRIDSDGNLPWGANGTAVCNTNSSQRDPQICSDGRGGAFITWSNETISGKEEVLIQHVGSSGGFNLDANGSVLFNQNAFVGTPFILSDGANGSIVAFYDGSKPGSMVFKLDASANSLWNGSGLSLPYVNTIKEGGICADGAGGLYITWFNSLGTQIQHIDANGIPSWGQNGSIVDKEYRESQKVTLNRTGGVVMSYAEGLYPDYAVFYIKHIMGVPEVQIPTTAVTNVRMDNMINCLVTDCHGNGFYTVFVTLPNGTCIEHASSVSWVNNTQFSIPIIRTMPGNYIYMVEIQSLVVNKNATVNVTVQDLATEVNYPGDILTTMERSDAIYWKLADDFGPGSYRVLVNDTSDDYYTWINWTQWSNDTYFIIPINRSSTGTFNYTVEYTAAFGQVGQDTVIVNILDESQIGTPGYGPAMDALLYTSFGLVVALGIILVVTIMKVQGKVKTLQREIDGLKKDIPSKRSVS